MSIDFAEPTVGVERRVVTPPIATSERIDCALPIVVGVTGHRQLAEQSIEHLERSVTGLFEQLAREYPSSPLTVLSPLAEGADRLIARVGLSLGARLVVPLPFDPDHYRQEFTTPESQHDFDALLARADRHFVLPNVDGHSADSTAEPGHSRDMHYAQVGAYIVRVAQILIALWDGDEHMRRGGTSDVVGFRLHGAPLDLVPEGALLDAPLSGPLYHIVTPSATIPKPEHEPYSVRTLYPSGYASAESAAAAFTAKLESVDRFNRDEQALRSQTAAARERSRAWLIPADALDMLDDDTRRLAEHFAVADTLALHFGSRSFTNLVTIMASVVIAVLFLEFYSHLFPTTHALLAGYLAAMVVAAGFQRIVRRNAYHTKFLDYRALAEGLRVQLFWRMSGLADNVADHYMRKQRSVLDWIRDAIRTWAIGVEARSTSPAAEASLSQHFPDREYGVRLQLVIDHWVGDQSRYFMRSAHRLHRRLHLMERGADMLFACGIVIAIALLAGHTFIDGFNPGHVPMLSIGVCLLFAGVLHGFAGKRAYPELSKQFERMAGVFAYAQRLLIERRDLDDHATALEIVKELGIEALGENGDWLVLHRERPVEIPKGH